MKILYTIGAVSLFALSAQAQNAKPEDTEVWLPEPKVVTPAKTPGNAPADAIVLFDGKNLDEWVLLDDSTSTQKWKLADGAMTVDKTKGDLRTKRKFTDYQLHIEYQIPTVIHGTGQGRGNSGIFLAALPWGAGGYELQVLDNYQNKTYVNGQVGSVYKQSIPLANAARKPGVWQTYDVIWTAPRFNADGSLKSPARVTAIHNGVLVQNNYVLKGDTPYIGQPAYKAHGPAPIKLQSHGDPSETISYRNIWVREL
ncbi:DUF1080 domain-containing protein [Mucilaginibacter defluvii]